MKLNLLANSLDIRTGYKNIDNTAVIPKDFVSSEQKIVGSISNLDWICKEGEAEEILALDCLHTFPLGNIGNVIYGWSTKLASSGKIIIGGNYLEEIAKAFNAGTINVVDFNKLLFNNSHSAVSIDDVLNILTQINLKVTKKQIGGFRFLIEAQK